MTNPIVRAAVAAGLLVGGCMNEGGSMDMTGGAADVRMHVVEIRQAQAAHESAIGSADTLDAMHSMERSHSDAMSSHIGAVGTMMGDMSTMCSHMHSGVMPDFTEMNGMMNEALDESADHAAAMMAATDMPMALAEESRHREAMMGMLDRMEAGADAMMASGSSYRCTDCCGH